MLSLTDSQPVHVGTHRLAHAYTHTRTDALHAHALSRTDSLPVHALTYRLTVCA